MLKILIGGSPCTYWSIAQKNNRETQPTGLGWELFENYLIAKDKFKPDIFLYENNKSAAQAIKDEIKKRFNVWKGDFLTEDTGVRYIEINSALVSAQSRKRFYVHNCGDVVQPMDRGIVLRDILLTATDEQCYQLNNVITEQTKERKIKHLASLYGQDSRWGIYGTDGLAPTITASAGMGGGHTPMIVEPICVNSKSGRYINGEFVENKQPSLEDRIYSIDGKGTAVTAGFHPSIAEPIRVGDIGSKSQGYRVYSCDGKSVTMTANGGGAGAKTGLYTCPIKPLNDKNMQHLMRDFGSKGKIMGKETDKTPSLLAAAGTGGGNAIYVAENVGEIKSIQNAIPEIVGKYGYLPEMFNGYNRAELKDKSPTLSTGSMVTSSCATLVMTNVDGTVVPVYKAENGYITIKGKEYPIKLADGYYIIRKLTVTECCRLQTLPDDYCRAVSNSQAYKGLGNGWTAEVIIHILNNALKNVPKDEELVVLSMYDGIGTGRYCLDKMGFTNVKYYAYEIDKYAKQIAMSNYPDIIQCGDAFNVRDDNWEKEFAGLN